MSEQNSNQELKRLKNSMTEVEAKQLQAQRKFQNIEPGTPRYKIGVHLDSFRRNARTHKINVRKILNYIKSTKLAIARMEFEISSGNITSEIAEGIKMNPEEVQMEIDLKKNMVDKEAEQLKLELWQLAQLVGLNDVVGNIIISEEEYNSYFEEVEAECKELGLILIE